MEIEHIGEEAIVIFLTVLFGLSAHINWRALFFDSIFFFNRSSTGICFN
jgi:hypothetical protein